nr:transposase [Nitrosomonas sp. H1_AOB3]
MSAVYEIFGKPGGEVEYVCWSNQGKAAFCDANLSANTFKVMPKRWIVERSFAWLEKSRRLWKNCERKLNTSLQFIHLAFLALLLKRS